jgi:gamma-glutamyltranspeptidase/glutathione hydrolase
MVIWNAESRSAVALDYRERAPQRATATMFAAGEGGGDSTASSRRGGLAAAIPGQVAGLCYALEHYGSLDLPTVLAPAIRLATEGFELDTTAVRTQRETLVVLERLGEAAEPFAALRELYLNDGRPTEVGGRFDSPLEEVLRRIASQGAEGFYDGEVGEALLAEVRRQGGLWTAEDLDPQRLVVEREPLRLSWDGAELLTMPPPSSGGVALIEMLQILDAYEAGRPEERLLELTPNGAEYVHRVTEAAKHAFADRATSLGDADFVEVPLAALTSRRYAERLAGQLDPRRTQPAERYGRQWLPDDAGTSHFSVLDAAGNAVACTETINTTYGSLVVEPRFGIVLNNEMDDFTARPGEPNAFGLIQSEKNAVAPGKKPLSSMTPTILVREGRAELAVGASGGPRIISGTLQVLLNVTRFGMGVEEAVSRPRFHHQWQPDVLSLEQPLLEALSGALSERGHRVERTSGVGVVQAAQRGVAGLRGASDPRKGGRPAGW